jgi:hypothetical protein
MDDWVDYDDWFWLMVSIEMTCLISW